MIGATVTPTPDEPDAAAPRPDTLADSPSGLPSAGPASALPGATDDRPIVVGVSGGIAAYKTCTLVRLLRKAGHNVHVVPTAAALRFVGAPTWEALSGRPVSTEVWDDVPGVQHVRIGQTARAIVVAPATADFLARAATGQANDLLTSSLLMARCPVIVVPAMHTEMWQHPATVANVATLRRRGVLVVDPASGPLTGPDSGPGRLPEPEQIHLIVNAVLATGGDALHSTTHDAASDGTNVVDVAPTTQPLGNQPTETCSSTGVAAVPVFEQWRGLRVLVSAGGTQEALDPVRVLTNQSSGKQGYAVAAAAAVRGAHTTVVTAADLNPPAGVTTVRVTDAHSMNDAMAEHAQYADVVVMAAAVSDYRAAQRSDHKLSKPGKGQTLTLELAQNPDILRNLVGQRAQGVAPAQQVIVGFAAEAPEPGRSVLDIAQAKLRRKDCDLLVVNSVAGGAVFGQDTNEVTVLTARGDQWPCPEGPKWAIAEHIAACISRYRAACAE